MLYLAHLRVVSRFLDDEYPESVQNPLWIEDDSCGALAPIFDMVNHSDGKLYKNRQHKIIFAQRTLTSSWYLTR